MIHSPTNNSGEVHALKFHGKASSFFIICLINAFLSLITLGIFLPWALVRCRRYIYENMELHGTRFGYHAKGRDIFISWFAITVIISILGFIESLSDHATMGFDTSHALHDGKKPELSRYNDHAKQRALRVSVFHAASMVCISGYPASDPCRVLYRLYRL